MKTLTIKEFSELLASGESPLLAALRKLTTLEKVEQVVAAVAEARQDWS